ncbi:MAG: hypothetical protein U9Q30_02405 [Campylobacterota bacterium]|nr:hypothetical protein [Campylobacterota bacterium]
MNKIVFAFLITSSFLYSQERSMFGAGDLESDSPYGLTPSEKVIVKNKQILVENEKQIKNVDNKIKTVDGKISDIYSKVNLFQESIEATNSLVEGNGGKLNRINISLNNQINKIENNSNLSKKNMEDIKLLKNDFQGQIQNELNDLINIIETNKDNIKTLQNSFKEIVSLLNDINKDYVSKSEFNKLLAMLDKKENQVQRKKTTKKVVEKKFSKDNKKLIAEARVLFKKDYFTKALPILEHLIEEKYRPAECNFLVGEIKFYRKKYKEAISYFKTSMLLYDKSKYLPKLLLHSAISFEKIKDNENARNFYLTLIDIYPESNEAKKASKKIKNLK